MKTIEEIDQEINQVQIKINELATHQQRLLGYREALIEIDQNNGTTKGDGSDRSKRKQ